MNFIYKIVVLLIGINFSVANAADVPNILVKGKGAVDIYNAIETTSLRISMGRDLNGFVEGKVCDYCNEIKVTITPETKAYEKNVEVPLSKASSRIGRYATVIFETKTNNVTAIRW